MIPTLKKYIPTAIKKPIRSGIKWVKYNYRHQVIKRPIANDQTIKVIVGAAETYQEGWYSTNEQWLDITNKAHWTSVFKGKKSLSHVVAEHVFEHLTEDQCATALQLIFDHMIENGRVRIAVPDGYNPDPTYIKHVGIKGIGDDAADHKQLLNVDTLSAFLKGAGFTVTHLEGYKKDGTLVQESYDVKDGFIMRSRANKRDTPWSFPDASTSLIIDGIKHSA